MRIVVTGGSGRVGQFVVKELTDHGHEVTNLDLKYPARPVSGVKTILGDAAKMEDAFGAISYVRAQSVIHLAAWSDPGFVADSRTYSDNVSATFNILNVCASTGIKRAIIASSAQVYGFAEHSPIFAPVDETHPLRPLNSYALSKIAGEQTAAYFTTRFGMQIATFRIMGARAPEDLDTEITTLASAPQIGRFLLWNRTDARDVARACRLALEASTLESGVYNITARKNALGRDALDLLRAYCPDTKINAPLAGSDSILSCKKAFDAFDYQAEYR
ncbi:MAG: NAD(P)-dependent oxidoreductase [Alphaproteobacteria bacterium]